MQASARSTFFVAISGPRLSIRQSNERVADYAHEESLRLRWADRARSASAVSNGVMATWTGDHCSAANWSATAVKGQVVIQFKLPNTAAAKGAEHDLSFLPGGNQCSATNMSATLRKGKLDADVVPTIDDRDCGTAGMGCQSSLLVSRTRSVRQDLPQNLHVSPHSSSLSLSYPPKALSDKRKRCCCCQRHLQGLIKTSRLQGLTKTSGILSTSSSPSPSVGRSRFGMTGSSGRTG